MFSHIKGFFYERNKLKQKIGLCGQDKKLSRATFGPRAVCCACLLYTNKQGQFEQNGLACGSNLVINS
jgi:hypothetical protein